MKNKIAIVSKINLPLDNIKGGVEAVVKNILNEILKNPPQGYNFVLINPSAENNDTIQLGNNLKIINSKQKFKSLKMDFLFHQKKKVQKIIQSEKPNLVQIHGNIFSIFLPQKSKQNIPYILTRHAILQNEAKYDRNINDIINRWIAIFLEKKYNHRVQYETYISNYSKDIFYKKDIIHSAIIPNPVKPDFFDIKSLTKKTLTFLYVGVINERKNILPFIESLRILKEQETAFLVHVVGGFGSLVYKNEIMATIQKHGLENDVIFHGWKSQEEIIELMKSSSIFVLPSRQETLPVSILEAKSAGRFILCSNVGGIPEIIANNKNGFLFNPNSPKTIIESLDNILKMTEHDFFKICSLNKSQSLNFQSPDIVLKKYLDFYNLVDNSKLKYSN